jgi:hypothetical protein
MFKLTVQLKIIYVIAVTFFSIYPACRSLARTTKDEGKKKAEQVINHSFEQIKDFGIVNYGALLRYAFIISDTQISETDVQIVDKSCSCLKAKFGTNEAGMMTLILELQIDKPAWQKAYAAVEFKSQHTVRKYAIIAYGKDSYNITPKIGYVENPDGGNFDYPVRIEYYTDARSVVEFKEFTTDIKGLISDQPKFSSEKQDDTQKIILETMLHYNASQSGNDTKRIEGNLKFVVVTEGKEHIIPMILIISADAQRCRITPAKVFLIVSKEKDNPGAKICIEALVPTALSSLDVVVSNNMPIEVGIGELKGATCTLDLKVKSDLLDQYPPGLYKGLVSIHSRDTSVPKLLSVPVSVFIRE